MAVVTGMTAEAMRAIQNATVVDGHIDVSGHLILVKYDGTQVDTGSIATAIPDASTDAAGIIQLATAAEVSDLSDEGKAVTPSGLSSALKAKIISGIPESADQTSYPSGLSLMSVAGTDAIPWTKNSGWGSVVTTNAGADRVRQIFYSNDGGSGFPRTWTRSYHSTSGGGGWTAWQQDMIMINLSPANFVQSTPFTDYPDGKSRLYYTTSTSTGWDFSGKNGEVVTYRDGTDFARQRWTRHVGGTTGSIANTEIWTRTANAANGWSRWLIVAENTGWNPLTLAGGYSLKINCGWVRINGIVYLKGAFTAPAGGYTQALTLPPEASPAEDKNFSVTTNGSVTMAAIVTHAGAVQTWTSAATVAWFSIAGIIYPTI